MRKFYNDLVILQKKTGFLSSVFIFCEKTIFLQPFSWVIHFAVFHRIRLNHAYAAKSYLIYLIQKNRCPDLICFLMALISESTLDKEKIWAICKTGLHAVQIRQLNPDVVILSKIEDLSHLISDRLATQCSYDCSYTLICLSLWRFQKGQMEQAIQLAALAAQADPTWGYPPYLLGWFGCFTLEFDPLAYFYEAIEKDWRYTKRILNDKIIQNQTEVLKKLKQKFLILNPKKHKILKTR